MYCTIIRTIIDKVFNLKLENNAIPCFHSNIPLHPHSFLAIAMSVYLNTIPQANADDSPSHNSFLIAAFVSVDVLIKIKRSAVNLLEIELQNMGTGHALVR